MCTCARARAGCSVRTWTPVRGFIHTDSWNGCDSPNAAAPCRVRCVRATQISYCFFVAMVTTAASFCVPTADLFLNPCVCERVSVSVCARLSSCPLAPVLKMPAEDLRAHCFHQSSRLVFSKLAPLPPSPTCTTPPRDKFQSRGVCCLVVERPDLGLHLHSGGERFSLFQLVSSFFLSSPTSLKG